MCSSDLLIRAGGRHRHVCNDCARDYVACPSCSSLVEVCGDGACPSCGEVIEERMEETA